MKKSDRRHKVLRRISALNIYALGGVGKKSQDRNYFKERKGDFKNGKKFFIKFKREEDNREAVDNSNGKRDGSIWGYDV